MKKKAFDFRRMPISFDLSLDLFRSSALNSQLVGRTRLRTSQPRRQHTEGRARNVIHSYLVAELDR